MDPSSTDRRSIETDLDGRRSWVAEFGDVYRDFAGSYRTANLWWTMAVWDIKRRYRRTVLGPFWSSASHAIYVGILGVLFAQLWKQDVSVFLPYFASGFLVWVFVSSLLSEGCAVFTSSESLIKQNPLPYTLFVCVLVARNLVVMAHHLAVFAVVAVLMGVPVGWPTLLALPGLVALIFSVSWAVIAAGILCARFRDLQQLVVSFLQLAMLLTPIFWSPESLSGLTRTLLVGPNVLYHAIMLVRMPLLGEIPDLIHWLVAVGAGLAGWSFAIWLFARYRRNLVFWL